MSSSRAKGLTWPTNPHRLLASYVVSLVSPVTCGVLRGPSIRYGENKLTKQQVSNWYWGTNLCYDLHRHSSKAIRFTTTHTDNSAALELLPSGGPATFPGSVLLFMPQVLRVYPVGQAMSSIPYKRSTNWISPRVRCWPENLSIQSQNLRKFEHTVSKPPVFADIKNRDNRT